MNDQQMAFDQALAALQGLGLPDLLPKLHEGGIAISRTVLGGSHSVAIYPPIDSYQPVTAARVLDAVELGGDTSLYIHIPFCETRCTFCHYSVEQFSGRHKADDSRTALVTRYLGALGRELAWWAAQAPGSRISSIYIGGGTPLVLEAGELLGLLETVRGLFAVREDVEICVEASPLTLTAADGRDKLRALREGGVTRLSFGVQSFDDEVLRYGARGYRRDTAIHAATIAADIFDNWNLDLIQGLYHGSPQESWANLQVLAELEPAHITWYHGRFADRPQGEWYHSKTRHTQFEGEFETLLGRMLIWQGVERLGYMRNDGNRFAHRSMHVDRFKGIRTSLSVNMLGVGASSYSHVAARPGAANMFGYAFRNDPDVRGYVERVEAGELPIASGRRIDGEELLAMSYATGLRQGRIEDEALVGARLRHPEIAARYQVMADELADLGLIERRVQGDGREGLRLSELGRLFEDETLAHFFSPAVRFALAAGKPRIGRGPRPARRPIEQHGSGAVPSPSGGFDPAKRSDKPALEALSLP
ncbi:radical SAM protein [Sphingomonas kyeonggiensis]|uniref:Coproporphyrinogen III oxidase-like Fe-S oxidoreductase n=1 Tax=Sphingomonas kyeonggiensis TaxID=1268553 RepID=A0A7W6JVP1_9SPHN|nr:radical SAM protein [Sphingomonas kyeonggiensis]MBB4100422.1 coproporphyrinogen III oxidase-like Fe-S oxidoreductase [Sphingomonas kyeonggiensis]